MPTFAAFWKGLDIADRAALGLIKKGDLRKVRQGRQKLDAALAKFLTSAGWLSTKKPNTRAALRACLACLSASDAEIVLLNLEDFWLETLPQNVPGTSHERPNWRRKTRFTLENICRLKDLQKILASIQEQRKGSLRENGSR